MTVKPGDETVLQAIAGPTTSPSDVPDPPTKKAKSPSMRDQKVKLAKRPAPTQGPAVSMRLEIAKMVLALAFRVHHPDLSA
jgi:hypothetical protein